MKKKSLYAGKTEILLALLFIISAFLVAKCCSDENAAYAGTEDKEQTIEMIQYQQSQGRFAVEENGYINIIAN